MKLFLALTLAGTPFLGDASTPGEDGSTARVRDWSEETLDAFARLPVQDEGRVKPLSTVAAFTLLRIHHKRSVEDDRGNELTPTEWLLDVLFYPDEVVDYPLFRVESHDVVQTIGVSTDEKKKRDLYSYEELLPGRDRLILLTQEYGSIDQKERTPLQNQVVNLGHGVHDFERLMRFLDFARARIDVAEVPPFAAHDHGDTHAGHRYSEVITAGPKLLAAIRAGGEPTSRLLDELNYLSGSGEGLRLLPPAVSADEQPEWTSPGGVAPDAVLRGTLEAGHLAMIADLQRLVDTRDRPVEFQQHLANLTKESRALTSARGELEAVDLEVSFYALDPFHRGLVLYLLGFIAVAATWLRPNLKRTFTAAMVLTGAGLAIQVVGVTLRCILRSRPPISTLYETILFVGATAVLVALVIERIDRKRIAGSMAPLLGALGLFLAMKFEELQGVDTMPQLVAVLDTNFWLATHVTCITLGYSAALLAAAFAHLYVLGKVFRFQPDNDAGYRGIARMVYGTICFSLIFSVVGTILGGVWANESWGRFWGWDPKENGALMIVLSQLALLHARMGGHIKAFGICMAAIAGGTVVAFSWWGVNLLGVGLHSYGFTDGVWRMLIIFYALESAVLLAGGVWWSRQRWSGTASTTSS